MMKMLEGRLWLVDYEVVHGVLSMGITLRTFSRFEQTRTRNA
jgi:hypothetical protein